VRIEIQSNNPVQPERLAKAPRCLAMTRIGTECQSPAVRGKKRCRMHGGTNPGAPLGNRNAWKHGATSNYAKSISTLIRKLQMDQHERV
jgi:glucans biosynthesis protein